MGNFITDTIGKIAGNVTQSVASAIIVTLITTYVLVDIGRKGKDEKPSGADSTTSSTSVAPARGSAAEGESGFAGQQSTISMSPEKSAETRGMNAGGDTKVLAAPATGGAGTPAKNESTEKKPEPSEWKELPVSNPTEQKLEKTITEGRAKGDSLLKAHPQDEKEVDNEAKKQVKDVKKRADDVFDELEQEIQK